MTIDSAYTAASNRKPSPYNPSKKPAPNVVAGLEALDAFSCSSALASLNSDRIICWILSTMLPSNSETVRCICGVDIAILLGCSVVTSETTRYEKTQNGSCC